jgi:hypothetical protein
MRKTLSNGLVIVQAERDAYVSHEQRFAAGFRNG